MLIAELQVYFQEMGTYDVKVVRHLGPGGDPKFSYPIEWIQSYRGDMGLYTEQPMLK